MLGGLQFYPCLIWVTPHGACIQFSFRSTCTCAKTTTPTQIRRYSVRIRHIHYFGLRRGESCGMSRTYFVTQYIREYSRVVFLPTDISKAIFVNISRFVSSSLNKLYIRCRICIVLISLFRRWYILSSQHHIVFLHRFKRLYHKEYQLTTWNRPPPVRKGNLL